METPEPNKVPAATEPSQETLFSDMLDTSAYQKPIKTGRIWLYVLAALQVGVGVYEYVTTEDKDTGLTAGLIDGGIGALFLLFAFLSYKKPFTSFVTALITYAVVQIGMMFLDPMNILRGIILKIIIIVALIRAIGNARDMEKFQATMR